MPKKPSRKTRRTQAARERAREAHARLMLQRQGDPSYVQQTRTETGRVIHLRPEDVDVLRRQQELFVQKFGREPGPDDPVFFDPTTDEPTEIDPEVAFPEIRAAAVKGGVDPAFIDAWAEVGYIITEANQHLFSAHEVEAYEDAVERAQDRNAARGGVDPFADDPDADTNAEDWDEDDRGDDSDDDPVVDLSPERLAAARAALAARRGLDTDAAISTACETLAQALGQVITVIVEQDGPVADIPIIGTIVEQPYQSHSFAEHVDDVIFTLREEALNWIEDAGSTAEIDHDRMPDLADFVLLSDTEQLTDWVSEQMSNHPHRAQSES